MKDIDNYDKYLNNWIPFSDGIKLILMDNISNISFAKMYSYVYNITKDKHIDRFINDMCLTINEFELNDIKKENLSDLLIYFTKTTKISLDDILKKAEDIKNKNKDVCNIDDKDDQDGKDSQDNQDSQDDQDDKDDPDNLDNQEIYIVI